MRANLWRTIALAFIAAAIAFVVYQPFLPQSDDFGLTVVTQTAHGIVVTQVKPGSAAARAGIRPGDTLRFGDTLMQRAAVVAAQPGTRVTVEVNGTRRAVLTARRMPPVGDWQVTLVRLAFLLVAGVLAWRRPEDAAVRWLVRFLWCYGFALGLPNGVLHSPVITLLLEALASVLFVIGTASAAEFAANFPAPANNAAARNLAAASKVVGILVAAAIIAGSTMMSMQAIAYANIFILTGFAVLGMLVIATFIVTYVYGAPGERQRRRWVFFVIGFALVGLVVDALVSGITGRVVPWLDQLSLVPEGVLPIGLAYVILRHRVIDIGFVLNRAVVYAGVSLIVVGTFVVVEYLLGKYVESTSHVTSVAVQLSVALALGFSIRFVHARVDRAVDRVLFRERHQAEAAIRTLAHDAAYVTNADVLLSRCVETVERYGGARSAGIWLAQDGIFRPARTSFAGAPEVDENDPAPLAMRARRATVHLPESGSALPGAVAFPMVVRGELLGMLVCGFKRDDETYAPDEEEALGALAAGVGHAIDAIEIRELRAQLARLSATDRPVGTF